MDQAAGAFDGGLQHLELIIDSDGGEVNRCDPKI